MKSYEKIIKERILKIETNELVNLILDETGIGLTSLVYGIDELRGYSRTEIYVDVLELLQSELEVRSDSLNNTNEAAEYSYIEDDPSYIPSAPLLKGGSILEVNEVKVNNKYMKPLIGILVASYALGSLFCISSESKLTKLTEQKDYWHNQQIVAVNEYQIAAAERNAILEENTGLQLTLDDMRNKMALLMTFRESGIQSTSTEEVKELLELASQMPFGSPFEGGHIVTSAFGVRDERWFGGDGKHEGIDIIPATWEHPPIVYTRADGQIIDYGVSKVYGKYVLFENESGTYRMLFGHLKTIYYQNLENGAVKNVPLKAGTRIGIMGNTGITSGPHLHYEIHVKTKTGEYVQLNPEEIIDFVGN